MLNNEDSKLQGCDGAGSRYLVFPYIRVKFCVCVCYYAIDTSDTLSMPIRYFSRGITSKNHNRRISVWMQMGTSFNPTHFSGEGAAALSGYWLHFEGSSFALVLFVNPVTFFQANCMFFAPCIVI